MGKPQKPFANRGPVEVTSISTAITPAATDAGDKPPIAWVQVVIAGGGTLTVKDELSTSQTYTGLAAGDVIHGPFTELSSMTVSKLRYGDGKAPFNAVAAPVTTPVRTGAGGALTNAGTTMSNIADLTVNVSAGQKFTGTMRIFANNSTGGEGIKFDFNGGTATFTSIEFGFTAAPSGATVGTRSSTAIGTAITCSAVATSDACFDVAFAGVCNAAGTLIPRFAENSTSSGTATVQINSTLSIATTAN